MILGIRDFPHGQPLNLDLDGNLFPDTIRTKIHEAFHGTGARMFFVQPDRTYSKMRNHKLLGALNGSMQNFLNVNRRNWGHKINIFRETASAVTPADGRAALKNQIAAFLLRIKLMQEKKLGGPGLADI